MPRGHRETVPATSAPLRPIPATHRWYLTRRPALTWPKPQQSSQASKRVRFHPTCRSQHREFCPYRASERAVLAGIGAESAQQLEFWAFSNPSTDPILILQLNPTPQPQEGSDPYGNRAMCQTSWALKTRRQRVTDRSRSVALDLLPLRQVCPQPRQPRCPLGFAQT